MRLLALAAALLLPASAPAEVSLDERAPRYLGIAAGAGTGNMSVRGDEVTFDEWLEGFDPYPLTLTLRAGFSASAHLQLGAEVTLLRVSGTQTVMNAGLGGLVQPGLSEAKATTKTTLVTATATWLPFRRWLFVRGGAGLASLQLQIETAVGTARASVLGPTLQLGTGVAIPVHARVDLVLAADASFQRYETDFQQPIERSRAIVATAGLNFF